EHYIMYSPSRHDSALFRDVLDPAGVVPRRISTMQLTEGIVALVKAGVGIAVLARWAIGPDVASGAVASVRVTPKGLHRTWSAVTIKQPHVPVHLSTFARMLAIDPTKIIPQRSPLRKRA